jgi:hypothetical protein
MQAREREAGSWLFEGNMRGVVGAGEEIGAGVGEPVDADRQCGPDRLVVGSFPPGEAVS